MTEPEARSRAQDAARRRQRELQAAADEVCRRILCEDLPDVDAEIAIEEFRDRALAEYPDGADLWERLYGSRFRRLWEQFRAPPAGA